MIWTKEIAILTVKSCKLKKELRENYRGLDAYLRRNNLYNKYASHLISSKKEPIKWTYSELKKLALQYKSKKEFRSNHDGAYQMAYKKGYINDICSHMVILNSKNTKDVYILYSVINNIIYVGITCNFIDRLTKHKNNPTAKVKIIVNSNDFKYEVLKKNIEINRAVKLENAYLKYFIKKGYLVANINATGSIGNPHTIKWTKESVHKVAIQFNKCIDFYKKYPGAYDAAQRNGWLNEVTSHIIKYNKPKLYMINNEELTITEICNKYSISRSTISKRIAKGSLNNDIVKIKIKKNDKF